MFKRMLLQVSLGIVVASSALAADRLLITGAGASFPYPIYSKWFADYKKENQLVEINYQSIGSGGGIKQLTAKTVDFGASDTPMSDDEMKALPAPVLHLPSVMGAVVLTYNLPGVLTGLKLDSALIADIFLGKVTKWNDPRIQSLNAGVTLPKTDIAVAYRSDSSGTTAVFTDYLAKVSPAWNKAVGHGKTIKWPAGIGGKGNEGVAGLIKNTPGAIGYVELVYAESQKLAVAEIKNKTGAYIKPSIASVTAAAAGAIKQLPDDLRVSITNADGASSYPISAFTYLLVYKSMDKAKGAELVKFLNWAMGKGQGEAAQLSYAPLPKPVLAKVLQKIKTIELK